MSIDRVREYLKDFGLEGRVREFSQSSATVELAAEAAASRPSASPRRSPSKMGTWTAASCWVAAGDAG